MNKIYGLCDVNNFYVSCERSFRPDLENKPVIVLSNNDGCAVARSNEVKNLGIKMGAPLHQIQHLVNRHDIQVFSSNYVLYGDMSSRFTSIIEQFTDQVEVYSIDESFISFDGFEWDNIGKRARNLVKAVKQGLGLPICIGLAPTKTLAKVANHYAKSLTVPGSVLPLFSEYNIRNALEHLPVNEIWGIGRKLANKLNQQGIMTALQLRDADYKVLQRMFSVNMERTILELRGQACIELSDDTEIKKQIICSRSFSDKITDFDTIRNALAYHVTRGCENLRKQNSIAKTITVNIMTNPFSHQDKQYTNSQTVVLPEHTDNTSIFLRCANQALRSIFRSGYKYKKAGIMLNDLVESELHQSDMFNTIQHNPKLMTALDSVNAKFGKSTLRFGSEGFDREAWTMKSNNLSPSYTTKWDNLVKV